MTPSSNVQHVFDLFRILVIKLDENGQVVQRYRCLTHKVDPSHEFSDRDYLHRPFTRLDDSFIEVDFHFESQQGSEPQVVASEPCRWMSTDAFRLCDWADYHRGEWREQLDQSRLSVELAGSKDPGYAFVETCCHQSPETGRSF